MLIEKVADNIYEAFKGAFTPDSVPKEEMHGQNNTNFTLKGDKSIIRVTKWLHFHQNGIVDREMSSKGNTISIFLQSGSWWCPGAFDNRVSELGLDVQTCNESMTKFLLFPSLHQVWGIICVPSFTHYFVLTLVFKYLFVSEDTGPYRRKKDVHIHLWKQALWFPYDDFASSSSPSAQPKRLISLCPTRIKKCFQRHPFLEVWQVQVATKDRSEFRPAFPSMVLCTTSPMSLIQ